MNDWWNYMAHSEVGGERKNHKYYARVVVGTDKRGRVQYRYFYDAREYGKYMSRENSGDPIPTRWNAHKTTYYTGKGPTLPNEDDKERTYNIHKPYNTKNYGSTNVLTPWQKTKSKISRNDDMERHTVSMVPKSKTGKKNV